MWSVCVGGDEGVWRGGGREVCVGGERCWMCVGGERDEPEAVIKSSYTKS